jgi:hypothetical protein
MIAIGNRRAQLREEVMVEREESEVEYGIFPKSLVR